MLWPRTLFGLLFDCRAVSAGWIRVMGVLAATFGVYYLGTAFGDQRCALVNHGPHVPCSRARGEAYSGLTRTTHFWVATRSQGGPDKRHTHTHTRLCSSPTRAARDSQGRGRQGVLRLHSGGARVSVRLLLRAGGHTRAAGARAPAAGARQLDGRRRHASRVANHSLELARGGVSPRSTGRRVQSDVRCVNALPPAYPRAPPHQPTPSQRHPSAASPKSFARDAPRTLHGCSVGHSAQTPQCPKHNSVCRRCSGSVDPWPCIEIKFRRSNPY